MPMPKDTLDDKIDNLAVAVGKGFKEVGERFDRLEGRMGGIEGRMGVLEQKIDLLRTDVAEIRFDHQKVLARVQNLELKTFGSLQE